MYKLDVWGEIGQINHNFQNSLIIFKTYILNLLCKECEVGIYIGFLSCVPAQVLMYLLLTFVDHIINRRLRFGYDIGKGFVVAKEEMLLQLDKLDFAHKEVVKDLKMRSEVIRLEVIKSLGLLRKEHPGVAQSVKTHQAIRSVLNHCDDTVRKMLGSGILDQSDADKLFLVHIHIQYIYK